METKSIKLFAIGFILFVFMLLPCMISAELTSGDTNHSKKDIVNSEKFTFKIGKVEANGLTFTYLELGEGPLIIALHGFPELPRTFRYQMKFLAEKGYHIIAPYMRGYYPTDAPPNVSYEGAALVQDTIALIDAFSKEPIILLGHDWGAEAAYGAGIIVPEKVSKIIAISNPFRCFRHVYLEPINPVQQHRFWYIYFFQMFFAEMAVAYDNFAFIERLYQEWSPGWDYPKYEMNLLKETFRKPGVLRAALNYYRHSLTLDQLSPELADIRMRSNNAPVGVPTFYIHGEKDGSIGSETVDGIEKYFTDKLVIKIIPEAGHFVHEERPEIVNKLIEEFLNK